MTNHLWRDLARLVSINLRRVRIKEAEHRFRQSRGRHQDEDFIPCSLRWLYISHTLSDPI